jgi:hypothetical protein
MLRRDLQDEYRRDEFNARDISKPRRVKICAAGPRDGHKGCRTRGAKDLPSNVVVSGGLQLEREDPDLDKFL